MRFPGMGWMGRIIGNANSSLVPYINSRLKPGQQPIKLIPFIPQNNNTFRLYNDKLIYNKENPSAEAFGIKVSEGGTISDATFATMSPDAVFEGAIADLTQALRKDVDTGFNKLMQYDNMSVRQYMLQKGYSPQQIDWMETINGATTHYDISSVSETAMDAWIFGEAPLESWLCVEGGMDRIIDGMVKIISKTVETAKRVTAIKPSGNGGLNVVINGHEERSYAHVINTVPLGAMQVMDMTELNLDYRKKLAIRKLQYDQAGKLGIKFTDRWWQNLDSGSIKGGQSFSDLPIRRCVYPSYGINTTDAAATMIASYTWGQDSARLGAYYTTDAGRERIVEITLRNLAAMHNVTYEFLQSRYVDSHLWNWNDGQDVVGAYALFGPSEYSTLMPALMVPAAEGRLHFAGEALSAGHAWIIGAVNSAYRTVAEILGAETMDQKLKEMMDTWGVVDEIDMGWYTNDMVPK